MDDHFDIARVFEIGKFDITRLTCIYDGSFNIPKKATKVKLRMRLT